jgi:hypothetical protein
MALTGKINKTAGAGQCPDAECRMLNVECSMFDVSI